MAKFEAERYLVTLSQGAPFQGIRTEIVALCGDEASTILTTARHQHADIIVLNSHGYTGVSRWMLGSVAEKVTRYAQMPVLLLHDTGPLAFGLYPKPSEPLRLLIPLDGSDHALAALEPAAELMTALAAPAFGVFHLVRVIDDIETLQSARYYLQTIASRINHGEIAPPISRQQIPVAWSIAVNPDVAEAILRVAEKGEDAENSGVFGGCDLMAMSTHGLTGHPFWSLGSITERVRVGTRLPLLIIRPATMRKPLDYHFSYEPEDVISEA